MVSSIKVCHCRLKDLSEELAAFLEDIYDKDIDQYIFK